MARSGKGECTACGLVFNSDGGFDAHRVGKHAYTFLEGMRMEPPREDGRRCLTPRSWRLWVCTPTPTAIGG